MDKSEIVIRDWFSQFGLYFKKREIPLVYPKNHVNRVWKYLKRNECYLRNMDMQWENYIFTREFPDLVHLIASPSERENFYTEYTLDLTNE